ncbi:MAG: hypothetical protein LEGION0398_MBIBDBAK_01427 [Legionellaceae bacterium]
MNKLDEIKKAVENIEKKIKEIDAIEDTQSLVSNLCKNLEIVSSYRSSLNLIDKIKTFLKAVIHGDNVSKAFENAFKYPSELNMMATTIKEKLEPFQENNHKLQAKL